MHSAHRSIIGAIVALLLAAAPAAAQVRVYVNPHIGVYFYDDAALACLEDALGDDVDCDPASAYQVDESRFLGATIGIELLRRLSIEGNFGFASLTAQADDVTEVDVDEVDGDLSLYSIGALLSLTPDSRLDLFLTGGVGGSTTDFDLQQFDSFSDVIVTVGGGLRFPLNDWVRLRGDVKSIVEFCEEADETDFDEFGECLQDSSLTHTQFTGGAELTIF